MILGLLLTKVGHKVGWFVHPLFVIQLGSLFIPYCPQPMQFSL